MYVHEEAIPMVNLFLSQQYLCGQTISFVELGEAAFRKTLSESLCHGSIQQLAFDDFFVALNVKAKQLDGTFLVAASLVLTLRHISSFPV